MTNSAIEDAINFLRSVLAEPVPSSEVRRLGTAQRHSWRTLERAAKRLGVRAGKRGAVWHWVLDDSTPPSNTAADCQLRQSRPPAKSANCAKARAAGVCEIAVQTLEQHLKHVEDGVGLGKLLNRMSYLDYLSAPMRRNARWCAAMSAFSGAASGKPLPRRRDVRRPSICPTVLRSVRLARNGRLSMNRKTTRQPGADERRVARRPYTRATPERGR